MPSAATSLALAEGGAGISAALLRFVSFGALSKLEVGDESFGACAAVVAGASAPGDACPLVIAPDTSVLGRVGVSFTLPKGATTGAGARGGELFIGDMSACLW